MDKSDPSETPTAQELAEPITYWLDRAEQHGAHPSQVGIARQYLAALQARAEQADRLRDALERMRLASTVAHVWKIVDETLAASEETQPPEPKPWDQLGPTHD